MVDELVKQQLKSARLRYVTTQEPGYTRQRHGKGFTYRDPEGQTVRDPALRAWFESIVIPPAWEDVWISPYTNGHILATGRDTRGRKQYRYHPDWQALRNEDKFSCLTSFGEHLPKIREVTDAHLRQRSLSREKVLAMVVRLLEKTLIRVGNREYAHHNNTYGLTTLMDDHVTVESGRIAFEFVGKSGKEHLIDVADRRLARAVKSCRDIPGQRLFQYFDDAGERCAVESGDVNAYLQEITGEHFTAKTFRTWGASSRLICLLGDQPEAETPREAEQQVNECVRQVAAELGNTVAVCRKYYLHPAIIEAHLETPMQSLLAKQKLPASPYGLQPEEQVFMRLMQAEG